MAEVVLRVHFGPEWERAQSALTYGMKSMNTRMADSMRRTTELAIEKVKEEALSIPVHGKKHRGTRAELAKGVSSKRTRRGRRITTSMPQGKEMLPRGFESQWKHPVFGHGPIVTQAPQTDWFIEPISHFGPYVKKGLEDDLEDMAQDVKRMTEGR